jgi:hypothetical protein
MVEQEFIILLVNLQMVVKFFNFRFRFNNHYFCWWRRCWVLMVLLERLVVQVEEVEAFLITTNFLGGLVTLQAHLQVKDFLVDKVLLMTLLMKEVEVVVVAQVQSVLMLLLMVVLVEMVEMVVLVQLLL